MPDKVARSLGLTALIFVTSLFVFAYVSNAMFFEAKPKNILTSRTGDPIKEPTPKVLGVSVSTAQVATSSIVVASKNEGFRSGIGIKVPILMYHHVGVNSQPNDALAQGLYVPTDILEQQLGALKKLQYNIITLDDLCGIIAAKTKLPPKTIVLTFDDGYRDFYDNAFPLLEKYNMKATAFIISGYLGAPAYLTSNEVKELSASKLVEIGAHTISHPDLKKLGEVEATQQITKSKQDLSSLIGRPVDSFAYPYGSFSDKTVEIVKTAGYRCAVSTLPGDWQSNQNQYILYRVRAGDRDSRAFIDWLNTL